MDVSKGPATRVCDNTPRNDKIYYGVEEVVESGNLVCLYEAESGVNILLLI